MRVTLQAVNKALAEAGRREQLVKGPGYFYFEGGDAKNWLDTTVKVSTLSSLTLEQWMEEFHKLQALNQNLLSPKAVSKAAPPAAKKHATKKRK